MTDEDYKREIESLKAERRRTEQDHQKTVEDRVGSLEDLASKIYLQNERQQIVLNQIKEQQDEFCVAINGTNEEPQKGLKVRVDRLEEQSKTTSWLSKTTLGAVIAAVVAWFFTK